MIRHETIEHDDYTIYVTTNDGLKKKGGELIVHATFVRKGSTYHQPIGKWNMNNWKNTVEAVASAVAAGPLFPLGLDISDWK